MILNIFECIKRVEVYCSRIVGTRQLAVEYCSSEKI